MKMYFSFWSELLVNRPKAKILLTLILIVILSWLSIFVFNTKASSLSLDVSDAKDLIILTNQERLKHNLSPLFPNEELTKAALNKATDLLNEEYFSHNSPEGKKFSAWVKDYNWILVGENLAMGFGSKEAIIEAWMNSENHRKNILHDRYKEIGIAVLRGNYNGQETKMVVQIFGATTKDKLTEVFIPYQDIIFKGIEKLNCYS